jgi:hypothetical protein
MRQLKNILLGTALAFVAALAVGLWLLLRETNVDRDQADYRARMHAIWSGAVPGNGLDAVGGLDPAHRPGAAAAVLDVGEKHVPDEPTPA